MEKIKERCNLTDDRLVKIIDSDSAVDRLEAQIRLLQVEISDKMIESKRKYGETNSVLVLGLSEARLFVKGDSVPGLNNDLDWSYSSMPNELWGMGIYIKDVDSCVEIVHEIGDHIYDTDED